MMGVGPEGYRCTAGGVSLKCARGGGGGGHGGLSCHCALLQLQNPRPAAEEILDSSKGEEGGMEQEELWQPAYTNMKTFRPKTGKIAQH